MEPFLATAFRLAVDQSLVEAHSVFGSGFRGVILPNQFPVPPAPSSPPVPDSIGEVLNRDGELIHISAPIQQSGLAVMDQFPPRSQI